LLAQPESPVHPEGPLLFWQLLLNCVSQYWLLAQFESFVQPYAQMPLKQNSPDGHGLLLLHRRPLPGSPLVPPLDPLLPPLLPLLPVELHAAKRPRTATAAPNTIASFSMLPLRLRQAEGVFRLSEGKDTERSVRSSGPRFF
jgi:hypothetical protein